MHRHRRAIDYLSSGVGGGVWGMQNSSCLYTTTQFGSWWAGPQTRSGRAADEEWAGLQVRSGRGRR